MKLIHTTSAADLRCMVENLLENLTTQMNLATEADRRVAWELNRINEYCAAKGYADQSRRDKIKIDYKFQDAVDSYKFHTSEVQRFAAALQGIAAGHTFLAQLPTV